jgi:putative membrane protein
VLLAVLYTTLWDNYLVAVGVWSYDPKLVSGLVIGWVPVEEYTFFVLETLLTGLWWWFISRRVSLPAEHRPSKRIRAYSLACLGLAWLGSVSILILDWTSGTYLALILVWALPALAPQLVFGADILWRQRKLVALTVLPMFFYLSAADALAIASGTWAIDPARTTGILIGTLPLEEAVFFGVTVILIGCGLTLALSPLSLVRWKTWVAHIRRLFAWDHGGELSHRG